MIDTVQAVVLFVIVLLAILFTVLGVQVFFILKDLRVTLQKTNLILDDVEKITEGIAQPVSSFSNFLQGARSMSTVAKLLSIFKK